jgi:hypothetical protein
MGFETCITRSVYRSGPPKLAAREMSKRRFTAKKSIGDQRVEEYLSSNTSINSSSENGLIFIIISAANE